VLEVKPKRAFAIGLFSPPAFWRVLLAVGWCRSDPELKALAPSASGSSGFLNGAAPRASLIAAQSSKISQTVPLLSHFGRLG
jgi:hypothetical protein